MNIQLIKKLRDETGAGVSEVKKALEDALGDYQKAIEILNVKMLKNSEKRAQRLTNDGLIHSYIHTGGKIGSIVHIGCETDFVAKTDEFKNLCHNIALHVCTGEYVNVEDLLKSEFVKDPTKTIEILIQEISAKTGEKIELKEFCKYSIF